MGDHAGEINVNLKSMFFCGFPYMDVTVVID